MTKGTGGMDVMMGDLVLTQEEVNPVMSALLENGLEATALHNHFFWDEPRMFYMHVHGHGAPMELARKVKPALDLIGKGTNRPAATPTSAPAAASAPTMDIAKIAQIAGHEGEQNGAVYKITVGRDDLKLTEMGAPINARMGLNTWAAFVGTNDNAAVAGDVAMLADEVTPVLKVLRQNGLDIVAIHHHMTGTQPGDLLLALLGHRPCGQTGGCLQVGARSTWQSQGRAIETDEKPNGDICGDCRADSGGACWPLHQGQGISRLFHAGHVRDVCGAAGAGLCHPARRKGPEESVRG